ncbi:hypothetical protein [Actinomadura napierensis]|uniref:MarR family transcriptional regulator n=1 Tax=Actinomadura napierensis TaxID=267854 RepID=A0ABN2YZT6_9ACTN
MKTPARDLPGSMIRYGDYLTAVRNALTNLVDTELRSVQDAALPPGARTEVAALADLLTQAAQAAENAAGHCYDHPDKTTADFLTPAAPDAGTADDPEPQEAPRPARPETAQRPAGPAAQERDERGRDGQIPARARAAMLALLAERGPQGARRPELVEVAGHALSTVAKWLADLRDDGVIAVAGSTRATRYYLPEHAPEP